MSWRLVFPGSGLSDKALPACGAYSYVFPATRQELDLIRAQLEVERSPRRSVCRLLEILRVPFGLLHAVYLAVCPYTTPPSRPH